MVTQIAGLLALSAVLFLATGLQITGEAEDGGPKGPITGPITIIIAFLVMVPAWIELADLLTHSENSLAFIVSEDVLGCTLKYEPWRIDRNHEHEWPRNQGLEFTLDFRADGE